MSSLRILLLMIRNLIHWNWSLTVLYKGKKKVSGASRSEKGDVIVVVILSQERNLIPFPSVFIWIGYLKFLSIKPMQSVNSYLYFK